ncbi:MAG: Coenzyme F420 hydrogenase/dehydrogenase, beta subunit C-terminal domain [Verrucomicrobiota bacterium]
MPERPLLEEDFEGFRHICLAAARDEKVRFDASSGGVARELARAALEKGLADAVYGVKRLPDAPFYEGGYFFDAGEVSQMANSVYCAFPFAAALQKRPGGRPLKRLLFIGTNCQLQAAQNFYKGTQTELLQVAIYCKQQKTLDYVRWLRREMGQPETLQAPVRFRGDGWPGKIHSDAKTVSSYFFSLPFGMETWQVPGCRFCPNAFGWKSDLVLFDPWSLIADNPGMDVAVLRTQAAQALWEAARERLVEWPEIPAELALHPSMALRPLTGGDVKTCIDWWRYRRTKVEAIPFYLGREEAWWRRAGYAFLEWERRINSWLLLRLRHKKAQYLLMRFWGKSSKVILWIVGRRKG